MIEKKFKVSGCTVEIVAQPGNLEQEMIIIWGGDPYTKGKRTRYSCSKGAFSRGKEGDMMHRNWLKRLHK